MKTSLLPPSLLALILLSGCASAPAAVDEHSEFEATLHAPYRAQDPARPDARTFTLTFDYPNARRAQRVDWQLELINPVGRVVRRWQDSTLMHQGPVSVPVVWSGLDAGKLASGIYQVRLRAGSRTW